MIKDVQRQQDRAITLLHERGMVRLSEFIEAGITAAAVSRMKKIGIIEQINRGLYQLPDAQIDANHSLAEAAKLVPKGVICLVSALAFHKLTDTIPSRVWIAIGPKDRRSRIQYPPLQFVRFGEKVSTAGIDEYLIESVPVKIYNPAKTIVDLFRYRRQAGILYHQSPGLGIALEGMREALRQRKATPSAIASYAQDGGVWKALRPYLEAMTANA
jgi:predicted transcriptional regulator of viral defense system